MKRCLLVALVVLTVMPGAALAQMMGEGMSGGGMSAPPPAQEEMKPPLPAPGMNAGMMAPGMMSKMMGQGKDMMGGCMMSGGMMEPEIMGSKMPFMRSSMMEGMMPARTRGCMMMAEGMMKGQIDLARIRQTLALSDEQAERLRVGLRPFQKETILTLASMKVAELELVDLLAGEKVDFGKVEAKLKEIEGLRTRTRFAHIKATMAVKGLLSKEQLEMLQGACECGSAPAPPVPQKGAVPESGAEHQHHH